MIVGLVISFYYLPAFGESRRVLIISPTEHEIEVNRIQAEVTALSFEPVVLYWRSGVRPDEQSLLHVVDQENVRLILDISADANSVEISLVNTDTPRVVHLGSVVPAEGPDEGTDLAVRTAEFLRATVLEVVFPTTEPDPIEPQLDSPDEGSIVARSSPEAGGPGTDLSPNGPRRQRSPLPSGDHRIEVGLGALGSWTAGKIGFSGHLMLEFAWMPRRSVGLHMMGVVPLFAIELNEVEGRADVVTGIVGAGLRTRFGRSPSRLRAVFDLGAAVSVLSMKGTANPTFTSLEANIVTSLLYLRPRIAIILTRWLQMSFEVIIGVSVPRAVVTFAGRRVTTWGQPLVCFGLSFEGLFARRRVDEP